MYRRAPLVLAVLSFAVPAGAQFSMTETAAAAKDPKAYTLDELSIEIERTGAADAAPEEPALDAEGEDLTPILDSIVNTGQKIWKIIEDNKPVVDVKTQCASALPEGVKSWTQMDGWQKPRGTIYRLTAKNAYGARVIDLRYQVLRTAGGRYKGAGRYLTAVSVEPLLVEVAWGYRLSLAASVPDSSIVNVGTKESPVAAMTAQVGWRISTAIKDSQGRGLYYLQGDGAYQELGGPFQRRGADKMKAAIAKSAEETLSYGP